MNNRFIEQGSHHNTSTHQHNTSTDTSTSTHSASTSTNKHTQAHTSTHKHYLSLPSLTLPQSHALSISTKHALSLTLRNPQATKKPAAVAAAFLSSSQWNPIGFHCLTPPSQPNSPPIRPLRPTPNTSSHPLASCAKLIVWPLTQPVARSGGPDLAPLHPPSPEQRDQPIQAQSPKPLP
jgi:hypothetical protein